LSLLLVRLDDRLIHGQVVVGWGRALAVTLVLRFASTAEAVTQAPKWLASPDRTIVVTGDIPTLVRLVEGAPGIRRVNLGGVHRTAGRRQLLPYLFLTGDEERELRRLAATGVEVKAQDVPTARSVPIEELV
jgi:mannose/fructose/N-acetylgalactosamine-specific phosphotransferase system component IIB